LLFPRSRRQLSPEIMDQPGLDPAEHAKALRGLGRVNRLSRSAAIYWASIVSLARARQGPVSVLDLACGGGDVPVDLALRAARSRLDIRVEGCDVSPEAVGFASKLSEDRRAAVRFFVLDALRDPIPEGYDVVTCSLFLHHLDESDAIDLLRKLGDSSAQLILVNDLARSRLGYLVAWVGCRLLSRSRVVHNDGPISVRSAFKRTEALELARRAGLEEVSVARKWPFRFLLSWSRP
jgi:SAM-dependent methyltransferase